MHEFCLIVGGESVAVGAGMEATFKNKNHVFSMGDGSFLLHINAGKSWKILEKSGNLIPEIRWEPCPGCE